ncbi:hypothetical protein RDV77_04140 [Porphyromonadaceae sp. NP-X]|jgi:hypothetical protein|nr:hypothetical protein [Porphyromonadaceae sp. NP-X]NMC98872.1 hypothetical protein [Bacteroidales bacterium]
MRRFILIIFLVPFLCYAQITKVNVPEEKITENIVAYDSLASINADNFKSHIGQTLFLKEDSEAKKRGYYSFYSKPYLFEIEEPRGYSDYNSMTGKYYFVDSILYAEIIDKDISELKDRYNRKQSMYHNNKDYLNESRTIDSLRKIDLFEGKKKIYTFRLVEKSSSDTLYFRVYETDNSSTFGLFSYFITVGYYEKLKEKYIGKKYVCQYPVSFNSIKNKNERMSFNKNDILKCIDISTNVDSDKFLIVAILKKNDSEKCYVPIDYLEKGDIRSSWAFKNGGYRYGNTETILLKSLEDISKESVTRTELIKRYGQTNANLILQGKVRIGFTKKMCIEAWGEPEEINTTTGSYGTTEQWVYSLESYLYFENGKLTTIQE